MGYTDSLRQSTNKEEFYKMRMIVLIASWVAVTAAVDLEDVNVKAPSSFTNYGCQCDSLTFTDGYKTHGNCLSTDKTGAEWCYVLLSGSTCTDSRNGGFYSTRFPGRKWSYEACATPAAPFNNGGSGSGCIGGRCNNFGSGGSG